MEAHGGEGKGLKITESDPDQLASRTFPALNTPFPLRSLTHRTSVELGTKSEIKWKVTSF